MRAMVALDSLNALSDSSIVVARTGNSGNQSIMCVFRRFFSNAVSCRSLVLLVLSLAVSGWGQIPLVNHGDSWRYRKESAANGAPQANWKTVADSGLDATWLTGRGGFGYADNATETSLCQTVLSDMRSSYS